MIAIIGLGVEVVACLGIWLLSNPLQTAPTASQAAPGSKAEGPSLTQAVLAAGGKLRAENRDGQKLPASLDALVK